MRAHLRKILSESLSPSELAGIHGSYDIVGDIAILGLTGTPRKHSPIVADAIMTIHKNVRTVLAQIGPVQGDFRLRKLEHIAGEKRTATVHRESGCLFSVDVAKCYFSPRLSHERKRIAEQTRSKETVVNMFAGVGCFSIIIAKHSNAKRLYSIDVNPAAIESMQKNVRMNGVYTKVVPIHGDAKEVIEERLCGIADRVLMPLPEKAYQYLPYALLALKKTGGWVHYYAVEHALRSENPLEKVRFKIAGKLENLVETFEIPSSRVVRTTGPNWYQTASDIRITSESVL